MRYYRVWIYTCNAGKDIKCQFHQRSTSSFYACRSQKCKKTIKSSSFFALLGSTSVKSACRMLVKLTPSLLIPHVPRIVTHVHTVPEVNLTNLLVQSANAPAVIILRHSGSQTNLHTTLPVHSTRSYAQLLRCSLYALCCKISVNLLAEKLLVEC